MNHRILFSGLAGIAIVAVTGCGHATQVASSQPITFHLNASATHVSLTLTPDPQVKMSNVAPPQRIVVVDLPVYPGATPAKPAIGIGDMGTPMDADLVDGTVYFHSKASQAQIQSWYVQQFKHFGYTITGQGTLGDRQGTTSTYYAFSNHLSLGDPTKTPNINLGFLSAKQSGETIFELKAYFIVTPPRPQDTYLPSDIVKVVLTEGKTTKTVTNQKWIADVVRMINSLQVTTPGISSELNVSNGMPTMMHATFYTTNHTAITGTYSLLTATLTVGNSKVALRAGSSPTLIKALNSVFGR